MSEERLRAMELTHQDLRDKIKELELWKEETIEDIIQLYHKEHIKELEQKLKNADDQAVANAGVILDLNKKINELEETSVLKPSLQATDNKVMELIEKTGKLEATSTNCEECKIIHLCPKHYEFCAPSGYENDYQHIVNIFKGKIGKLEANQEIHIKLHLEITQTQLNVLNRFKELEKKIDSQIEGYSILYNQWLDKLTEKWNKQDTISAVIIKLFKSRKGFILYDELLEQLEGEPSKIKTVKYHHIKEEQECKGCDYDYSEDCTEGCLKQKYYEEQEKEEQEAFKPKLPFHDYTYDKNLQEFMLGEKEANPKIITIDEAKENLKKHVEQIKQELKERNEREAKEAEPAELYTTKNRIERKELIVDTIKDLKRLKDAYDVGVLDERAIFRRLIDKWECLKKQFELEAKQNNERFCQNCGETVGDLICAQCNENTIKTYEKKQEQKDIAEFITDLYKCLEKIKQLPSSSEVAFLVRFIKIYIEKWERKREEQEAHCKHITETDSCKLKDIDCYNDKEPCYEFEGSWDNIDKKEAEPIISPIQLRIENDKRMKNELIAEFIEKILAFNYALPAEPQIIEIREWLEAKLK